MSVTIQMVVEGDSSDPELYIVIGKGRRKIYLSADEARLVSDTFPRLLDVVAKPAIPVGESDVEP